MKNPVLRWMLCIITLSYLLTGSFAKAAERVIHYTAIQGSISSKLRLALDDIAVQKVLLNVSDQPKTEEYLKSALQAARITPRTLVNLGLLRRQNNLYAIDFYLFRHMDEARMREITEAHARKIAVAILNRRTEIETIMKEYRLQGVDPHAALYMMLGCFSLRDESMVQKIRKIGREEMERWFESGYRQLHDELAAIAPFRYGVSQEDFFYEIWHDIFGAANRILVESGLFADPYSEYYGAKGVIPLVFEKSLYSKP
jgi:hypothetical protein